MRVIRRIGWVLTGLAVLAGAAWLFISLTGLRAPRLSGQAAGEPVEIGAYGPLAFAFDQPVQPKSVEGRLLLNPPGAGQFRWAADNRSVMFWPDLPFQPGAKINVQLPAGVMSENGLPLRRAASWQVEVRQPEVLFLSPSQAPELRRVSAEGAGAQQLTSTGGRVYDYSVSRDGSRIFFSARNEQQGIDLWEIDRQGGDGHLLLPCHTDWCTSPALSPDNTRLAYSRRRLSGAPGADPGPPQIWTLEMASQVTEMLPIDPNIGGAFPVWSPDGRYLAFTDETAQAVHVFDRQTKADFAVSAGMGSAVEWSPDSKFVLYPISETSEEGPSIAIYRVDVRTQKAAPFLEETTSAVDFSVPAFTPDGAWLAVGRRLADSNTKQLWLMRGDGSQRRSITGNALANHAGYQWDPGGARLVFQRLLLGDSMARPEILLWDRQSGNTISLAQDAFQARWLP